LQENANLCVALAAKTTHPAKGGLRVFAVSCALTLTFSYQTPSFLSDTIYRILLLYQKGSKSSPLYTKPLLEESG